MSKEITDLTQHIADTEEKNISYRKLPVVQSASFDTIIEALKSKSERAQCTFLFRLVKELPDEVLAVASKYSQDEIVSRARRAVAKSKKQGSNA